MSGHRGQRTHTPGSHVPSAAWQEHGVPGMTVEGIAQTPAGDEEGHEEPPRRRPQRILDELGSHGVRGPLRLPHDQATGQELDGLVLVEHAQVDQPVVLLA